MSDLIAPENDYQQLLGRLKELAASFRRNAHHLRFEEAASEWEAAAEQVEALLEEVTK